MCHMCRIVEEKHVLGDRGSKFPLVSQSVEQGAGKATIQGIRMMNRRGAMGSQRLSFLLCDEFRKAKRAPALGLGIISSFSVPGVPLSFRQRGSAVQVSFSRN